jgi:hypothetical protein
LCSEHAQNAAQDRDARRRGRRQGREDGGELQLSGTFGRHDRTVRKIVGLFRRVRRRRSGRPANGSLLL